MPRFRKKPVEVEAVQFTGDNWADMHDFTGHSEDEKGQFDIFAEVTPFVLSGICYAAILWNQKSFSWERVALNAWIVKNEQGEFSTYSENAFANIYEKVSDE